MLEMYYWVGGAIIFALIMVAAYLQWRLFKVRQRQQAYLAEMEQKTIQLRSKVNQSLQIICRSLLQGQVGVGEASVRVCGLLDQIQVPLEDHEECIPFAKVADAIRHIPILEQWKALPKKEKANYQKLIDQKESELGEFVLAGAKKMLGKKY